MKILWKISGKGQCYSSMTSFCHSLCDKSAMLSNSRGHRTGHNDGKTQALRGASLIYNESSLLSRCSRPQRRRSLVCGHTILICYLFVFYAQSPHWYLSKRQVPTQGIPIISYSLQSTWHRHQLSPISAVATLRISHPYHLLS